MTRNAAAHGPALVAESARDESTTNVSVVIQAMGADDVATTRRASANGLAAVRRQPRGERRSVRQQTGKRNLAMIP